jgi:hypothetical protein
MWLKTKCVNCHFLILKGIGCDTNILTWANRRRLKKNDDSFLDTDQGKLSLVCHRGRFTTKEYSKRFEEINEVNRRGCRKKWYYLKFDENIPNCQKAEERVRFKRGQWEGKLIITLWILVFIIILLGIYISIPEVKHFIHQLFNN